jgi:hypothetical protein
MKVIHCITREMGLVDSVQHTLFMNLIEMSIFVLSQKCYLLCKCLLFYYYYCYVFSK